MKSLSKNDIERYRQDITSHGVQGVIRTYDDLLNKGYDYAGWAKGVAQARGLSRDNWWPDGTVTGRAAMLFMRDTSKERLTQEKIDNVRIGMAEGYLEFLDKNLGKPPRDVNFDEMRNFHRDVFIANKLSIKNWTLETPMKLIEKYEGKAEQTRIWENLRKTQGEGLDALTASRELYAVMLDYADGRIQLNRQGRRINSNSGGGVLGLSMEASFGRVKSIDSVDVKEVNKWIQDVSRLWPVIKAEVSRQDIFEYAHIGDSYPDFQVRQVQNNFDLLAQTSHLIAQLQAGNPRALAEFTAQPEIQAAAQASREEAQMLLRQNPHLADGLPLNRFNRPEFSDMPPQVQKLYAEGKEKLQGYYQEHGIRYGEEALENTAMALAAEGYRNRMRSVTMIVLKDGQVHIGDDTAPDFRRASVDAKEAGLTAGHESMARAQETEQDFALQAQQREMERMAESRSRGMSMG